MQHFVFIIKVVIVTCLHKFHYVDLLLILFFCECVGLTVSKESIRAGLEQTRLQGRMQFLTKSEASAIGIDNISLLIDGGLYPYFTFFIFCEFLSSSSLSLYGFFWCLYSDIYLLENYRKYLYYTSK